ncbi:MAG: F0F1 ATP synthase subunit delta [Epsilonproteobacteria bacterium]|nr:F0F1 ATP synthase subunit delta [Campylobacterota bacterium]
MINEKYANALLSSLSNDEEIVEVYEAIARVSLVCRDEKFILVVKSPELNLEQKIKFLSEIAQSSNPKLLNFFKILLVNKRIDHIGEIYQALYNMVSNYFNTYAGVVEGKISDELVAEIEKRLSQKFSSTIKLEKRDADINGIKVFVDVLNVEIAIDENRIKQDLVNTILKAI